MKKWLLAVIVALLTLSATGVYIYATSSNPTPEERQNMPREQLKQIEPAYDGDGRAAPRADAGVEDLMMEEIAPEDQEAVREMLTKGEQPKLKQRDDGLLVLDR